MMFSSRNRSKHGRILAMGTPAHPAELRTAKWARRTRLLFIATLALTSWATLYLAASATGLL